MRKSRKELIDKDVGRKIRRRMVESLDYKAKGKGLIPCAVEQLTKY